MIEISNVILVFILIMPFYSLFMTIFFHKIFESGFKSSHPEETVLYIKRVNYFVAFIYFIITMPIAWFIVLSYVDLITSPFHNFGLFIFGCILIATNGIFIYPQILSDKQIFTPAFYKKSNGYILLSDIQDIRFLSENKIICRLTNGREISYSGKIFCEKILEAKNSIKLT